MSEANNKVIDALYDDSIELGVEEQTERSEFASLLKVTRQSYDETPSPGIRAQILAEAAGQVKTPWWKMFFHPAFVSAIGAAAIFIVIWQVDGQKVHEKAVPMGDVPAAAAAEEKSERLDNGFLEDSLGSKELDDDEVADGLNGSASRGGGISTVVPNSQTKAASGLRKRAAPKNTNKLKQRAKGKMNSRSKRAPAVTLDEGLFAADKKEEQKKKSPPKQQKLSRCDDLRQRISKAKGKELLSLQSVYDSECIAKKKRTKK